MRTLLLIIVAWCISITADAQHSTQADRVCVSHNFADNAIILDWSDGTLHWSAYHGNEEVVAPSRLAMITDRGTWGESVTQPHITRTEEDDYNSAIANFGAYSVEIRAYYNGVAYRFISNVEDDYKVIDELAEFSFSEEDVAWIPYVNFKPDATSEYATQFYTSFENTYTHTSLKDIDWRRLIFTPIVVEHNGIKVGIIESNLEDYPGMFISNRDRDGILDTEFATVPREVVQGDYNMLQGVVVSREPYIAECSAARTFPWRGITIAEHSRELAHSDLVWHLADECRLEDTSWIKPGKVAWEWWNDWGLEGIDFKAGINNATSKYYIDFASRYGIEYVILDEGWSVKGAADLMQVVPEIDIKELVDYAAERNVGIILWAGYWALNRNIEGLCKHYSEMGVKGWKVDFLDRDDQQMVRFVYDVARIAAKYHMLVDYHGVYKPTGLQRTYPNAINFEGVHGLETMKWLGAEHDQITYDVTIPFIRAMAGPMDYTPGAMRNAAKGHYEPNYSRPMSQGTRCHQLAMYVVYNQPLAMLCDSPTAYEAEPEYTRFLAEIPTTWDSEYLCIEGEIGDYVIMYREATTERHPEGVGYIAALNGNDTRSIVNIRDIISAVGAWSGDVEIYMDGENATTDGSDMKHMIISSQRGIYERDCALPEVITMAPGGGFVIKLT